MSLVELRRARVRAVLEDRLSSLVVVCETVRRRHNVSAILRSAEGFGIHEVHLVTGEFRPSRGAARGAERWVDLRMHAETSQCVGELKARGFDLWVADLAEDACGPDDVPVDRPIAVLFGAEMSGVSDEARSLARGVVKVPMVGLTQSLNVSAAAACVLYRLTERRREWLASHTGSRADLPVERQEAFFADWLASEEAAEQGRAARMALHYRGEGRE